MSGFGTADYYTSIVLGKRAKGERFLLLLLRAAMMTLMVKVPTRRTVKAKRPRYGPQVVILMSVCQ